MGLTPKQERNGIPEMGASRNTAQPSQSIERDVRGLMRESQTAADERKDEAHNEIFVTPQGNTPVGREVGAYGDMFEWDAGLAISEPEGEA